MATQVFLPHLPPERVRLTPVGPRSAPLFSFGLLTVACALASFAFACATPFAAFAVIAAQMLSLPSAFLVVASVWAVNQAIGFGVLRYPIDTYTILWGVAIGASALASTAAAVLVLRFTQRANVVAALSLALAAAYTTYELVLVAATLFLGGEGAFTPAIIGWIGVLNILWLTGLAAVAETVRLLNWYQRPQTGS
jgi:hypothetical protein